MEFLFAQISPQAFEKLSSEGGLLGVLLFISLGVIGKLYFDLQKEKAGRLQDAKNRIDDVEKIAEVVKEGAEAATRSAIAEEVLAQSINKLLESVARLLAIVESRRR